MTTLGIGTEKGGWLVDLETGDVSDTLFPGWKVTSFGTAPDGTWLAGVASNWFGAAVYRLVGGEWQQVDDGPAYDADSGRTLNQIWTFTTAGDRVYAGVDEAGVFSSDDQGVTWQPVPGINDHRTRPDWEPGFGGLCAHRILVAGERIWVAMSAVGVFRSDDGGRTFESTNRGVSAVNTPEPEEWPEVGYCVHGLTQHPDEPDRIWRQDHTGVYRTEDGADVWERIETGLPAGFGFPIVRDDPSGRLFVAPLHSDEQRLPVEGEFGVWRSEDDGDTWSKSGSGWPEAPTYATVLRGAMVGDGDGGVYLGTTSGDVWFTRDAGDNWSQLGSTYPRILAVAALSD